GAQQGRAHPERGHEDLGHRLLVGLEERQEPLGAEAVARELEGNLLDGAGVAAKVAAHERPVDAVEHPRGEVGLAWGPVPARHLAVVRAPVAHHRVAVALEPGEGGRDGVLGGAGQREPSGERRNSLQGGIPVRRRALSACSSHESPRASGAGPPQNGTSEPAASNARGAGSLTCVRSSRLATSPRSASDTSTSARRRVFLTRTTRASSIRSRPRQESATAMASRSVSRTGGSLAPPGETAVRQLMYVAFQSTLSASRRVVKSALPIPVAFPYVCGVRSQTTMNVTLGLEKGGSKKTA